MWVIVMFDLPVKTKMDRRRYARFRKHLLSKGFFKIQYSVYARPFESQEKSESIQLAITHETPPSGFVRMLMVTDKQFASMKNFMGKKEIEPEPSYRQIMLF